MRSYDRRKLNNSKSRWISFFAKRKAARVSSMSDEISLYEINFEAHINDKSWLKSLNYDEDICVVKPHNSEEVKRFDLHPIHLRKHKCAMRSQSHRQIYTWLCVKRRCRFRTKWREIENNPRKRILYKQGFSLQNHGRCRAFLLLHFLLRKTGWWVNSAPWFIQRLLCFWP